MQGRVERMLEVKNSNDHGLHQDVSLVQRFMLTTREEQTRAQQFLQEDAQFLKENMASIQKTQETQLSIMDEVLEVLKSSPLLLDAATAMNQPFNTAHILVQCYTRQKSTKQGYTQADFRRVILSRLNSNRKRMQFDVQENYNQGTVMLLIQQDRCVYVLTSEDLASWIRCPTSRVLVINGNMNTTQFRSPLSFISARLVYTLDLLRERTPPGQNQVAALHFFCGEHTNQDNASNSAAFIIQNLLAQLLDAFRDIDLIGLISLGDFQGDDLDAVCQRFKCALKLLPATAVIFCITDNLPFYLVDEKASGDAVILLRWLLRLTRRQRKSQEASGSGCTFKLLLTAAVQFMEPEISALGHEDVMTIPVTVPQTGGFTDMKWEASVGKDVEKGA
ncbi:hypothetical protein ASPZODRAFT_142272 [Penicilliopsis zonata CBS 506.65]|uniref:Uncharacterized protein n=1 Tax=Penicilliopsis zonata CBS 506.65 TaxID=1073090 RepID=A0A1L9SH62_9EURO|nr:hypothetical protein ASPZODRAFT_142272 [Penicilliopsis zonata CBS 506.65]OJJ46457.1 hypothetical protein ASPZODRAFT_142272 [Penicilliopsis zonata CBS 506.65]